MRPNRNGNILKFESITMSDLQMSDDDELLTSIQYNISNDNSTQNGGSNGKNSGRNSGRSNAKRDSGVIFEDITMTDIKMADVNMRCAPSKQFQNGSCIRLPLLVEMAKAYNSDNPKNKINVSNNENQTHEEYKEFLVNEFKEKLSGKCKNQLCWIEQPFIRKLEKKLVAELQEDTFRPDGPQGKFTWLNTTNIDGVVKQYERKFPNFKFLGAVPLDFYEINYNGIAKINFDELVKQGITKIGIVFNTDPHYKSGQHWISMYADFERGQCYFFDSYGRKPEKQIKLFMDKITNYMQSKGKRVTCDYNRMQHQKGNSNCGLYSIAFILRLLRGDTFDEINNNRVSDSEIGECRKHYFT